MKSLQTVCRVFHICKDLLSGALQLLRLTTRSQVALTAEILFLRKQLAFYQERKIKPRRFNDSARLSLLLLAKLFDWKKALINVKPETFLGWHGKAFRFFWRWKSCGGRPRLPKDIRQLIEQMAINNPTWGQKRVADELSLKLGILVSPRTVRNYWPDDLDTGTKRVSTQRWMTFVCLRFCHGGDSDVPQIVCSGGYGGRDAEDPPLQCDRASYGRLDLAAVPRSHSQRSQLSISNS